MFEDRKQDVRLRSKLAGARVDCGNPESVALPWSSRLMTNAYTSCAATCLFVRLHISLAALRPLTAATTDVPGCFLPPCKIFTLGEICASGWCLHVAPVNSSV